MKLFRIKFNGCPEITVEAIDKNQAMGKAWIEIWRTGKTPLSIEKIEEITE